MRWFGRARVIPGATGQAGDMSGQAEPAALAEQAALAQRVAALARVARAWEAAKAGGLTQEDPDFEPIAGVGLEQFAAFSRGIAAFGHDRSKLVHVIVSAGIPVHHWETAAQGWRDRIQGNHAVARRFNQFYREAWA